MPRELTYSAGELVHPPQVNGRGLWTSPEVERIVDKLQNGDPTLGWEGDPRLALYVTEDGRWSVERYEADGEYRTVCVSRPGLHLDERLIKRLVKHDQRRGFDPVAAVQEYRPQDQWTERDDAMREGLEKVYHGAAKDLGIV